MNDDLISRSALKKYKFTTQIANGVELEDIEVVPLCVIDNAPPVSHGEWIPVSERFPKDETEVLIQYGQSMMVGYHIFDYTIYPSGFEDENETGWYDSKDDFICGSDEVIAWMPLPEQYKEAEE